ncbi:hypothetical protein QFC24_006883 [Naganishia onofrii]|uniref:Uncharacterized protein n=1 Tax=Naganishia onofrii TaxID=1851511 RepID=A0ACC2WWT1_9TREE|nr:hypothetical protein QFC24_006883 [Naganishia onofrii]
MNTSRSAMQLVSANMSLFRTSRQVQSQLCRRAVVSPLGQTRSYNPFQNLVPEFMRKKKDTTAVPVSIQRPEQQQTSILSAEQTPTEVAQAAPSATTDVATEDIFAQVEKLEEDLGLGQRRKRAKEHKYSTARFKISPRKLNMLGRQIAGQPVNEAILQMEFSEKRASERIKSTLVLARNHAVDKGMDDKKLVVSEAWVSKGINIKRIDIKGRARHGIKEHQQARMHVLLKEGKTRDELLEQKQKKLLTRVRNMGAGVVREDRVIINAPTSGWRW